MSIGFKVASALHSGVYRMTGGMIGGRLMGAPVLLLTTIGGKTGKRRTTPLLYGVDGDRVIIVASKGGAPEDPAWYRNLVKNPVAEVEMGREKKTYRARTASAEEKPALWSIMTRLYSGYDGYQKKTSRNIPVVVLDPAKS